MDDDITDNTAEQGAADFQIATNGESLQRITAAHYSYSAKSMVQGT